MYHEVAKGRSFNKPRGVLIHEDNLYDWIMANGDEPIGMSIFQYDDHMIEVMETESPSIWYNQAACPWVPIDIDKGDNTDEKTLDTVRACLYGLASLNLCAENYKIYFSGTGYHIMIHGGCFNFPEKHKDLPYVVKATMENLMTHIKLWDAVDDKVYMRTSIIRCPYSLNPKQGLFKIPLSLQEVMSLKPEDIHKLAETKRLDFPWLDDYYGNDELANFVVIDIPPIPAYSKVAEPKNRYSCIYRMLSDGPVQGTRNNTLLVLSSHFMSMGVPSHLTKDLLLTWNDKSLDERLVIEKVEQVYLKKYRYTCKNRLMKKFCSTRCHLYSNQTKIVGNIAKPSDILAQAKETDFVKLKREGMQIGKLFGVKGFSVMRGEIVSLLGVTKAGKTTLVKNILYGMDLVNPTVMEPIANLRKTLYYSSEQAPNMFYFTAMQMMEGCTEEYANNNREQLYNKWEQRLSVVNPVGYLPNKESLYKDIIDEEPEVVVIDTLEHAVSGMYNEHQAMKDLMIHMQQISLDTGIIFFIISQVGRADSRDLNIDLFSGKGSGSIENQSRKVFAIYPSKGDKNIKTVVFLADSYGEIPDEEISLFRTRSGRFKVIYT